MRRFLYTFLFLVLPGFVALAQDDQDSINVNSVAMDTAIVDSATIADTLSMNTALTVQQKIEKLLESSMFKTSQVGLMVWNLDADSLVFAYNERQLMRPASTLKLLTGVAALDRLSKDYILRTQVFITGKCDSTGLDGDVYIRGGMDPSFSRDDMDRMVSDIAALQGDTIRGRLVADLSFKDSDLQGKGWCWDDDNPVLSALLYRRKDNFVSVLREKLKDKGVVVLGNDSVGLVPKGSRLLTEHFTNLGDLFKKMMKNSDNLYAECVLYQMGATGGRKTSAKSSIAEEKKLLRELGLNPDAYKIADGSGLSLYNYLSPEVEIKVLRFAYQDKYIYNALYNKLPVAGVDGTLRSRLRKSVLKGRVHAKTGTLTGVSTLAGYLTNRKGENLAFCIFNQGVMHAKNAKNFQDDVLKILY